MVIALEGILDRLAEPRNTKPVGCQKLTPSGRTLIILMQLGVLVMS
jgi:hypothetical protein